MTASFVHAPAVAAARPLEGRAALVTGAGRGLGAAIARRLDAAGARVALVGRDRETLEAAAATLANEPVVLPADLAEPEAPHAVLADALAALGRLDVLVNNAGVAHGGPAHELDAAEVDGVLALNVRAPLLLAGAAAERMARSGGGSIINISSALARLGIPQNSVYAATKGAVEAATRALAAEWGPQGVRVNAIRPAVTRSDMSAPLLADPAVIGTYLTRVPLGSVGEAEDIAAAVQFLATDEAGYVTGQTLDVDGGWGATAPSIFASS
jgi:NAD(P)-dependent dehydrogenase (short-subunit alcohol dehydrogenase family)